MEVGIAQPGAPVGEEAHRDASNYNLGYHRGEGGVLDKVKDVYAGHVHRARRVGEIDWWLKLVEITEVHLDAGWAMRTEQIISVESRSRRSLQQLVGPEPKLTRHMRSFLPERTHLKQQDGNRKQTSGMTEM